MKCKHRVQIEDLDNLSAINLYTIGPANNKKLSELEGQHTRMHIYNKILLRWRRNCNGRHIIMGG